LDVGARNQAVPRKANACLRSPRRANPMSRQWLDSAIPTLVAATEEIGAPGAFMPELANLTPMMHHVCGYSFSRASTVMRHQPLKYSGGVMDSSRAG